MEVVAELLTLQLAGLGTNLTCYGGVVPTPENLGLLVELAAGLKAGSAGPGQSFFIVSGRQFKHAWTSRSLIAFQRESQAFAWANPSFSHEHRHGLPLPGSTRTPFVQEGAVIEMPYQAFLSVGETTQNGLPGRRPPLVDRGPRLRALCALGRQDCVPTDSLP